MYTEDDYKQALQDALRATHEGELDEIVAALDALDRVIVGMELVDA